jgi:hypothetical protein
MEVRVRSARRRVVEAIAPDGALRLTFGPSTQAFTVRRGGDPPDTESVVLAEPRGPAVPVVDRVRELGPDVASIRPMADDEVCFDLGLGRDSVRFMVRLSEPGLINILRRVEGERWETLMERYGQEIVRVSPTRVLASATCRVEVVAPIPPPEGRSPDGSHTHLLRAHLKPGRDLPVGVSLPAPLVPVATFHPYPGWPDPIGENRS